MHDQAETVNILSTIASLQSAQEYQELNWEGSLEDYLKLVQDNPRATRNAFQRIYDMILSHGVDEHVEHKKKRRAIASSGIMPITGGTQFTESIKALRILSTSLNPRPVSTEQNGVSSSFMAR